MVVTGGDNYQRAGNISRVSRYNLAGWVEDLPNLVTGRASHGCSSFIMNDIKVSYKCCLNSRRAIYVDLRQAYIVAGGYYTNDDWSTTYTASTEMYIVGSSEWRVMAPLPVAVARLAGVTLSNTVYMTGQ